MNEFMKDWNFIEINCFACSNLQFKGHMRMQQIREEHWKKLSKNIESKVHSKKIESGEK